MLLASDVPKSKKKSFTDFWKKIVCVKAAVPDASVLNQRADDSRFVASNCQGLPV